MLQKNLSILIVLLTFNHLHPSEGTLYSSCPAHEGEEVPDYAVENISEKNQSLINSVLAYHGIDSPENFTVKKLTDYGKGIMPACLKIYSPHNCTLNEEKFNQQSDAYRFFTAHKAAIEYRRSIDKKNILSYFKSPWPLHILNLLGTFYGIVNYRNFGLTECLTLGLTLYDITCVQPSYTAELIEKETARILLQAGHVQSVKKYIEHLHNGIRPQKVCNLLRTYPTKSTRWQYLNQFYTKHQKGSPAAFNHQYL